ncbi:CAP domain-containing protein [Schizophyllum amplum]|uniref:CAP domain-containing protein n=1 Tax=Schizophyllum amplum TaxID=97359 RepID=A0A550CQS2_9AGAR|nr:CAP domain-containing protein [Auriculariopsis ampla]
MQFKVAILATCAAAATAAVIDTRDAAQDQWLKAHNDERAAHGAAALTWNQGLADKAASWASQCVFEHSNAGQNLASTFTSVENVPKDIPGAVKQWNDERSSYDASSYSGAGHWTQVVWKGTTSVGCAAQLCAPGTLGTSTSDPWKSIWYYVCNYDPAGNIVPADQYYPQNVQP